MACGTPEDLIMGGAFETFFSKEGIVFDPNTGKLNTVAPTKLIGGCGGFYDFLLGWECLDPEWL